MQDLIPDSFVKTYTYILMGSSGFLPGAWECRLDRYAQA
jgi:hypothetical protein